MENDWMDWTDCWMMPQKQLALLPLESVSKLEILYLYETQKWGSLM